MDPLSFVRLSLIVPTFSAGDFSRANADKTRFTVSVDALALRFLIEDDRVELVHAVLTNPPPLNASHMAAAVDRAHFGVVRQLLSKNCPFNIETLLATIAARHISAISALVALRPDFAKTARFAALATDDRAIVGIFLSVVNFDGAFSAEISLEMIKYLLAWGLTPSQTEAAKTFTRFNDDERDTLLSYGFPLSEICFDGADDALTRWLFRRRCPVSAHYLERVLSLPQ